MIDHTDSPGMRPEDVMPPLYDAYGRVLRPSPDAVPAGVKLELPTFTCAHCGGVVVMNMKRTRPRHYCPKCDHHVCDNPVCATDCRPIRKLYDVMQEAAFKAQGKG